MMDRGKIIQWLREHDPARLEELWKRANDVRLQHVGQAVHLRGLVEISNCCSRGCYYCGLRSSNRDVTRYRLSHEQILQCAQRIVQCGFGTIVMQSGEDYGINANWMANTISKIKQQTNLAITLSLGERTDDDLALWKKAGADRYLLRFETSNESIYKMIHPPKHGDPALRIDILNHLRSLGYEVGSGVMIGLPRQTYEDLANDILLFRELDLDMIGVGPFIPPDLELPWEPPDPSDENQVPNTELMTYKVIALTRILCPTTNIPSTTALATLNRDNGHELALSRGANVIMPNMTPATNRPDYQLYPNKACLFDETDDNHAAIKNRVTAMGRIVGTGRGDSPHCVKRDELCQKIGGGIMNPITTNALSPDAVDFINDDFIENLLRQPKPDAARIREVIDKSLAKEPLSVEETATLLLADEPDQVEQIFNAARELKRTVYGNRIVLFAPLYVGNLCINDCSYCAFRKSNPDSLRRTLSREDIENQVKALEDQGHKRLILVFGEHAKYDANFIADTVRHVYSIRTEHGEIRRLNINAAPLDIEGFRTVGEAGIGTYQVFQETYHHETYKKCHPAGTPKGDYLYRLDSLDRAQLAGVDDVGIGALFGLYDWRFEVLGLVTHALHMQKRFGVGPHTISFPRLRPAQGVELDTGHDVSDQEFKRLIAILRLAVPYTGLIMTAREEASLRHELMEFGVSQIDAGSRIEIGGYTEVGDAQCMEKEQFELGDIRPLDQVMRQLLEDNYLPSFCTACYRKGRTGEHFMEFAIPGFIKRFCTPNGLTTLMEYLVDYASEETRQAGEKLIAQELDALEDGALKSELLDRLRRIKEDGERDLNF